MSRVILSYGMGVESTAILLRWLEEPGTRWFGVKDLTILTAMTGDEFTSTGRLVEEFILPRIRAHGIRYVQVAREDKSESVAVLDDSTNPEKLHLLGRYRLSDELLQAGTVPTSGGVRKCSIHAKGWPLDAWLERELGDAAQFDQVIGFNAGEMVRVRRDQSYGGDRFPGRRPVYPLVDWGWDRDACEDYIESLTGVRWPKSACAYCPFAAGKETVMARFREEPEAGGYAMLIEFASLCMNDRMTLYSTKSLRSVVERDGNVAALEAFEQELRSRPWAIYRVRRYYTAKAHALRSIEKLTQGSRENVEAGVQSVGGLRDRWGIVRAMQMAREENVYPSGEEFLVAAPAVVLEKTRPGFEPKWEALLTGRRPRGYASPNPPGLGPVFDLEFEEDDSREEQLEWERALRGVLPSP